MHQATNRPSGRVFSAFSQMLIAGTLCLSIMGLGAWFLQAVAHVVASQLNSLPRFPYPGM
jgi:hypothetical protein